MSNKIQLQNNNEKLTSLIETLRGKAAGGGAAFEPSEVTLSYSGNIFAPGSGMGSLQYTDSSGQLVSTTYDLTSTRTFTFVAAKSTIVVYSGAERASTTTVTGGTKLAGFSQYIVFSIEDATVTVNYT